MTIFHSSYNTTVTDGFNLKKTIEKLEDAKAMGGLSNVGDYGRVQSCQGGTPSADAVPQFKHPIFFSEKQNGPVTIFDARPFGGIERVQGRFAVSNLPEYDLILQRSKLDYIWNTKAPSLLRDVSSFALKIYASWVSEAIAHKFTLDSEEQLRLQVLAAWFYMGLFTDDIEPDETERQRMVGAIARATEIAAETVFQITDDVKILPNLKDFCTACYAVTGSVRLKEFNAGVLFTVMGGTWFGPDRAELCGVAMEHPPTWLAIIYASFVSRTFKNTRIERLAQVHNRKDAGPQYMRSISKLCSDYVGE